MPGEHTEISEIFSLVFSGNSARLRSLWLRKLDPTIQFLFSMDNQPAFDRSILIPIFISGFSVIGIIVVLMIGRALNAPAAAPVTPSVTPFQYVYLGTEPAITTPLIEGTLIAVTEEPVIEEPTEITPVLTTPTRPGASTPIILPSATGNLQQTNTPASPTVTSASGPPLNPGTYDDVYPNLIYNGWNATGSSGSTLHISLVPGSTISFRFIGRELRLVYQGGSTLGQMRITIDNLTDTLNQSSGNEWVSDQFANGTHSVLITHIGGGSVNLDQVIIPEPANTPTPTRTPTQNP